MFRLLSIFLLLPLFEIVGFIVIGGRIGFLRGILWLIAATMLGRYLLQKQGRQNWRQTANIDDIFTSSRLFDDISVTIGAYLLIFPGFISDFLSIPFLLAPLRGIIFRHMNSHPENFVRRTTRRHWTQQGQRFGQEEKSTTIIDGTFRRLDDE